MGSHQVCELGGTSEGMEDLTGGLAITFKLKKRKSWKSNKKIETVSIKSLVAMKFLKVLEHFVAFVMNRLWKINMSATIPELKLATNLYG